jgi:hypothetical protein
MVMRARAGLVRAPGERCVAAATRNESPGVTYVRNCQWRSSPLHTSPPGKKGWRKKGKLDLMATAVLTEGHYNHDRMARPVSLHPLVTGHWSVGG